MNMHTFYKQISSAPVDAQQVKLVRLTHLSRNQILNATNQITWFIWNAETPTVQE